MGDRLLFDLDPESSPDPDIENRRPSGLADNGVDFQNPIVAREDWTQFRSTQTLGQVAGVERALIPMLVAKELMDNALDTKAVGQIRLVGDWLIVRDHGPGIPGDDDAVADLFSISRPTKSSKYLRLPNRGALGNGLRVVVGAIMASQGDLLVSTGGRTLRLYPEFKTGRTTAERIEEWDQEGTEVRVRLGDPWTFNRADSLHWASLAIAVRNVELSTYRGRSSAHWYDSESFRELLLAWDGTVRDLVARLEGCAEPKAGRMVDQIQMRGRRADSLETWESDNLLEFLRKFTNPVKHRRLGEVGNRPVPNGFPAVGYAKVAGTLTNSTPRGPHAAKIPMVIEAWAAQADEPSVQVLINRTIAPMSTFAHMDSKKKIFYVDASNWGYQVENVGKRPFRLIVNVSTPYMPIYSQGKMPDLNSLGEVLDSAVEKAVRQAKNKGARSRGDVVTFKSAVLANLEAGIEDASSGGQFRFNQRHVYYRIRDAVAQATGKTLKWGTFVGIIDRYEAEHGRIDRMVRDDRGKLYHPHTRRTYSLGTTTVEEYERPAWTFNKILFVEKETHINILIANGWAERNDCALVTTKGQPTRAVRDLFDLLGETDEPLAFFALHDADGPGTIIYQSLVEATIAREARRVPVHDLGLSPEEGLAMGLPVEHYKQAGKIACADAVPAEWREWYGVGRQEGQRIELNAMTAGQYMEWLDSKFAELEVVPAKVIPPRDVLGGRLQETGERLCRESITERVIAEARVDEQVESMMAGLKERFSEAEDDLDEHVADELGQDASALWSSVVDRVAGRVVDGDGRD